MPPYPRAMLCGSSSRRAKGKFREVKEFREFREFRGLRKYLLITLY